LPGDYSFAICKAVCGNNWTRWIGCSNELNAAYAADGYSRIKGAALLSTTYGVGELSALNAVMGAKAENVLIFHIVGLPAVSLQKNNKIVHHGLPDNDYGRYKRISKEACCITTTITENNYITVMDRVISKGFIKRQPVYIGVSSDIATTPINFNIGISTGILPSTTYKSDNEQLNVAKIFIISLFSKHRKIIALPGYKLSRYNIEEITLKFIEKLNCPYISLNMDKGILPENHDLFIGGYSNSYTRSKILDVIDDADLLLETEVKRQKQDLS